MMSDLINLPAHVKGLGLSFEELDSPLLSLDGVKPKLAKVISLAIFNTGFKVPGEKDFQLLVSGLFGLIRLHYPGMKAGDLVDALYRGSIGDFGFEIFGVNLLTLHKWIANKSAELARSENLKEREAEENQRKEDIARISEIKAAFDVIKSIAIQQRSSGKKGYEYFIARSLSMLLHNLSDLKPNMTELIYMLKTYTDRRANEPEPRTFLLQIRERNLITVDVRRKIFEYLESLENEQRSNN